MPQHLLVTGTHYLLAAAFCARKLESSRAHVHWRVTGRDAVDARDLADGVRAELRRRAEGPQRARAREDANERLHVTPGTVGSSGRPDPVGEAWLFVGQEDRGESIADVTVALGAAAGAGCRMITVVREAGGPWPAWSGAGLRPGETNGEPRTGNRAQNTNLEPGTWNMERRRATFAAECAARDIEVRELVVPLVAGPWSSRLEAVSGRFVRFLWTLQELQDEIDARCPDYFELQAIRCRVPGDAVVELLDVRAAVDELVRTAREDWSTGPAHAAGHAGGRRAIASRAIAGRAVRISHLLEQVGRACGIGLLAAESDAPLNAVDALLHDRLGEWLAWSASLAPRSTSAAPPAFDDLFGTIRARHEALRQARDARIRDGACVSVRQVDRDGRALTYDVAGEEHGEAVVFINALGQGLAYWHRLVDEMARRHRAIVWQLRGLEPGSPALRTPDHVDDLESILRAERIDRCHLVGWCTGAKVAVECYLRQPERVSSIAFLNATFKDAGTSADGDTPYEQNLVELCRAVDEHPVLAGALRRSLLKSDDPPGDASDDGDADALAFRALTDVPLELRPHVLEPFQTEATTVAYAKQVLDFIDCDALSRVPQVTVPVLVICCEHDAVASPSRARLAVPQFPLGRHVEVRGATHYCLYERPHVIAGLLEELFASCAATAGEPVPEIAAACRT